MSETQATKDRLGDALADIPGMPEEIIRKARDGYYDDYLSPLAEPLGQLVRDLAPIHDRSPRASRCRILIRALVLDVEAGRFDGTLEEARAWRESAEGQKALAWSRHAAQLGRDQP